MEELKPEESIIGLTLQQATTHLTEAGLLIRATYRDGQPLIVAPDFVPERVNVALIDDIIAEVLGRG